ncbi:response regulator transcription factor [Pedobacter punctiformis]|uniref:Response regulator transcription factor n=1 Tax=Pedobacter punctiformis TaxID=3004097 RepID=A0ABT4L7V6_9SPHI|nr:response regulator transcription factor [Pedobacter sp. HCMS5-2]MCZ4244002.1 response regulator transcription factor [Pedobacter sp. HCMS5-2]
MIKIILVEDHNIVRNGIKMLLESEPGITITDEAENGSEALELIRDNDEVDLVLTDINMAEMDGLTLIKEVKKLNQSIKVIVLSMLDDEKQIIQAFNEGAEGYLLKNIVKEELIFGIKQVYRGGRYLSAEIGLNLLNKSAKNATYLSAHTQHSLDFSSRELEVLHLVAEGFTNNEMADKLFLSKRTVEGHRQALIDKTGMKNTAALIRFALVNGLIQ